MRKITLIPNHWSRCFVWCFEIKAALTLRGRYVNLYERSLWFLRQTSRFPVAASPSAPAGTSLPCQAASIGAFAKPVRPVLECNGLAAS